MNKYPYLTDVNFLTEIYSQHLKEQYAKITILSWAEDPIQDIQGRVLNGNLNNNGDSAVRRNGNITVAINDTEGTITELKNLFSLNKKVNIEIGYKNTTNKYSDYPIIWFPQGVFVILSPNLSHSSGNATTVSLRLEDKMCLLNGTCGGVIAASTQFDEYDTVDENGEYITRKPTIYQIIQELVNHFGEEQLGKIIISDIDTRIKKVMRWVGGTPLYLKDENFYVEEPVAPYEVFEYGEDVGYIYTDFYFPSELIANAGDSVCTILDKIKNTLGNFEYFYDIDGNFIFREKKNFLNTTQSKIELDNLKNSNYLLDMSKGKSVYQFNDSNLINSYSNSPRYENIKNDFVVWGIKKNANGNDMPIRYHLAIDKKPKIGNEYTCFFYEDEEDGLTKAKTTLNFESKDKFPKVGFVGTFYQDLSDKKIYKWNGKEYQEIENAHFKKVITKDWRSELYLSGVQSEPLAIYSNYYYPELQNEWTKQYDLQEGKFKEEYEKTPSRLDFFLDFIDTDTSVAQFSIENIGRRTVVENDNDINCVFDADIPNYVLIELGQEDTEEKREECEAAGQPYIQVTSAIYSLLSGGGRLNSAYNRVREMLYQYTSYNESISIQCLPIYHLDSNTRITVSDVASDIHGDYIINSISIPLDINGTMSISATRAIERL